MSKKLEYDVHVKLKIKAVSPEHAIHVAWLVAQYGYQETAHSNPPSSLVSVAIDEDVVKVNP